MRLPRYYLVCWFSNIKLSNNVFIKTSKASKINANIYARMNIRSEKDTTQQRMLVTIIDILPFL